jgi:hypothetical protein
LVLLPIQVTNNAILSFRERDIGYWRRYLFSSSIRSGVLALLNARSQRGERNSASGLAVAVSTLRKKNRSPSSGRCISLRASSAHCLSVNGGVIMSHRGGKTVTAAAV